MSGIAGIVNLDGAPVDRDLLARFEKFLGERGPDAHGTWAEGNVGLVHTLFATSQESRGERQPMSIDGQVRIAADARIDGREDLIRELAARGRDASLALPDAELILHAYAVWGEACVEHLLGDFVFAIWDARERKLFCARDHFGVKPFFYAHVDRAFLFSNSMDVPRLHPDVPDDLYERAIGEFLVLGRNTDLARTARAAIWRLPPAHVLVVARGEVRTRRYWTLPEDSPTVFRHSRDYVERFLELFEQAVGDRLRTDCVAVLMSGGMDSSSVAAMAKRVGDRSGCKISAHTKSYERLFPHDEGALARCVARYLGISWREFPLDRNQLFGLADKPAFRRPQPEQSPMLGWTIADELGQPLPARVFLTGQGGDPIFSSFRLRQCRARIREGQWLLLAKEVAGHLLCEGRMRRLRILEHVKARLRDSPPPWPFPDWLNPDLERRLNLRETYERHEVRGNEEIPNGAVRPEAYDLLSRFQWVSLFEGYDPNGSGVTVEPRHPLFDLRLMRYALSLPAMPWCSDKELLRRAMRGFLPDEIRLARKRPLERDFLWALYESTPTGWLDGFEPAEELGRFVNVARAVEQVKNPAPGELPVLLLPFHLNYWLKWESQFAYNFRKEECRVQTP